MKSKIKYLIACHPISTKRAVSPSLKISTIFNTSYLVKKKLLSVVATKCYIGTWKSGSKRGGLE
jgi:hypothetical protein